MAASAAASAAASRTASVGHYPSHHPVGSHHDTRRMVAVSATGQSRLKPQVQPPARSGHHRGAGSAAHQQQYSVESGAGSSSGDRRTAAARPSPAGGRRGPASTGAPPPPPPVHATSSRGYSHRYVTGVDYYSEEEAGGCCCLSSLCRHCDFIQVIAFICGLIVVLLMILCLASSNWLTAEKFRQGLWEQCIDDKAPQPLPFDMDPKKGGGCYPVRQVGYIQAAAVLCVLTLLFDIGATVMTGCGLCSKEPQRKYLLYRIALYVMVSALLCILVALVIYPACFAAEIEQSNRQLWEFGWAYGVGWGAAIFLFGAILLLLCDKETEEIYYKERAITHHHGNDSKA